MLYALSGTILLMNHPTVKSLIKPPTLDARKFEKKALARFAKASFGSPSGLSTSGDSIALDAGCEVTR